MLLLIESYDQINYNKLKESDFKYIVILKVLVGLRTPKFPPKFEAVDVVFFSADYASLGCI